MTAARFSGVSVSALQLLIGFAVPDLRVAALADERDLLLKARVLPQLRRDQEASLLVRLALRGIGEEEAHLPCLRDGQCVVFIQDALPARLGIDGKAVIQSERDIEGVAKLSRSFEGTNKRPLGSTVCLYFPYIPSHLAPF